MIPFLWRAPMKYYEDFEVGDRIATRARTVTEADIVFFASLSGDWYPLHTDIEYAKKSPFGERIAHGFLVLSIASGLIPLSEMAIVAFYGMDGVRFLRPTKIWDTIKVELEVVEKRERDEKTGIVAFKETIRNQREEEVAVGVMRLVLSRKD